MHTEGVPQTVSATDGWIEVSDPGHTYTLNPHANPDSAVTPIIAFQRGVPMQFVVDGPAGGTFRFQFRIQNAITLECNDSLSCSFSSDALYWKEKDAHLNPNILQSLTADSSGKITLTLGLTITIPPNPPPCSEWDGNVFCLIETLSGDSLSTSAGFHFYYDMGDFEFPIVGALNNLSRGYTYSIIPDSDANPITPVVNGREHATIARVPIYGIAGASVLITFVLPTGLLNDDENGPPLPCRFSPDAIFVEETGARADPNYAVPVVFGSHDTITLDIGITVSVSAAAVLGDYTGQIIASVAYIGNERNRLRTPQQSEFEILYTASVNNTIPQEFSLLQNYPNPFNSSTTIRYGLPVSSQVRLSIFDLLGRQTATLVDEFQYAGSYTVHWQGEQTPSGFYVYRLTVDNFTQARKLLLLR